MNRNEETGSARTGVYVYGITDTGRADRQNFPDDSQVFAIEENKLVAMVRWIDVGEFEQQVKELLAEITASSALAQDNGTGLFEEHEMVVEEIMQHTTVLPMKFGTIFKDEEAIRNLLRKKSDSYHELLARFTGCEEWGVKIYLREQALLNALGNVSAAAQELSPGTAYMLSRMHAAEKQKEAREHVTETVTALFYELQQMAKETRIGQTFPQVVSGELRQMLLNAAFLVNKEQRTTFLERCGALQEQYRETGYDIETTGPWPLYNFIQE